MTQHETASDRALPHGVDLSILSLGLVEPGESIADHLTAELAVAQLADRSGFRRFWVTEHHNTPSIPSPAPAVLVGHVAAKTNRIRVGSGGVMLSNHAPLAVAEQFGVLATLFPDRIDLGVGRSSGADGPTTWALRTSSSRTEAFPRDVVELRGYFEAESAVSGVHAYPGRGLQVPVIILGTSLFGASVAAELGLPFAFGSHFAPGLLDAATDLYRERYQPTAANPVPHVLAGINVIAASDPTVLADEVEGARRARARIIANRPLSNDEADDALDAGLGTQVDGMLAAAAFGGPASVRMQLGRFARAHEVDELLVLLASPTGAGRLRSTALIAPTLAAAAGTASHRGSTIPALSDGRVS